MAEQPIATSVYKYERMNDPESRRVYANSFIVLPSVAGDVSITFMETYTVPVRIVQQELRDGQVTRTEPDHPLEEFWIKELVRGVVTIPKHLALELAAALYQTHGIDQGVTSDDNEHP